MFRRFEVANGVELRRETFYNLSEHCLGDLYLVAAQHAYMLMRAAHMSGCVIPVSRSLVRSRKTDSVEPRDDWKESDTRTLSYRASGRMSGCERKGTLMNGQKSMNL